MAIKAQMCSLAVGFEGFLLSQQHPRKVWDVPRIERLS